MSVSSFIGIILWAPSLLACGDDGMEPSDSVEFSVRVENVAQVFSYPASGVFNTPVGTMAPGPIGPGGAYEFSFDAAPGAKLSFATMFVHSNDLFYAPGEAGIALYDGMGAAVTGDVTSQLMLWDAGTEVNQEPGLGADQAPRQSGPDTGAADADNSVRLAADEFDNLPAVAEVVQATVAHDGGTRFTVRITNVATATTVRTSDGNSTAAPLAPGVWVVHTDDAPLFTMGQPDRGAGLEALAEDGNAATLGDALADNTGLTTPLSPGVWAVHTSDAPLFTPGAADRGEGLEALAEDGDPAALATALANREGVVSVGTFTTPDGAMAAGVILPDESYAFTVTAAPGDRLSLATMFVQSNDLFYAPSEAGISLFDAMGMSASGDVTSQLMLWDAGTETNEAPGAGANQAPRQSGPDTGANENGTVRLVSDGYTYPDVADIMRVTVTPLP
jgi:hypothetical protein